MFKSFYLSILTLLAVPSSLLAEEALELQFQARHIVAMKCWKCHGSERDEGDIRFHTRKHLLDSGTIDLKNPEKSKLLQRINLPEGHKEIMPSESKPLSKKEISILTEWIKNGLKWDGRGAFKEASLDLNQVIAIKNPKFKNTIDLHVDQYFKSQKITWKPLIDDITFLRRAYLDCIGTVPTIQETSAFLADGSSDKRNKLIQDLLSRNSDYNKHWITFWNDLLRNDYTGPGFITKGRKQITKWIRHSLASNKPYNIMVQEIFSKKSDSHGFIAGIQWRGTVSASQTIEMQAAQNSAQAFLGVNIKCASCHDAFTSNWSLQQSHQFASIFSKKGSVDIHRCDKPTGKKATPQFLYSKLGKITPDAPLEKRLRELGNIITDKKNGRFARTIVNRYWSLLMGRGIIYQVDEMDSIPWSADVLDDLSYRFVEHNYDLKWLIAEIMTSQAYQLPTVQPNSRHELSSSSYTFRGPVVKRLSAEQFADVFSLIVTPIYATNKDGSIIRASEKPRDLFQTALGRPSREIVTSTRAERGNLLESLELTNGTVLDLALGKAAQQAYKKHGAKVDAFIEQLFQRGLTRQATEKELKLLVSIYHTNPSAVAYHDIIWIFINLPEFQSVL